MLPINNKIANLCLQQQKTELLSSTQYIHNGYKLIIQEMKEKHSERESNKYLPKIVISINLKFLPRRQNNTQCIADIAL